MNLAFQTALQEQLPLAASPQLAENSRLGFATDASTLRWATGFAISSSTLSLSASLYDGRVGSRSTGKERDTESGNDYFKYRYYASSMGRWLSPDPSGLSHADLGNPQSLNLYNYVGNRPLTLTDLDGLCWKGFQWACDLGNAIKNLAIDAKNKIVYGEWTTNTKQALMHKLVREDARTRRNSYRKETQPERYEHDLIELPQLDPNGPPVPRLIVRATAAPPPPAPPSDAECIGDPDNAMGIHQLAMQVWRAQNNLPAGSSSPSDDDAGGGGGTDGAYMNLTGARWEPMANVEAAAGTAGAALVADHFASSANCFGSNGRP